MYPTKTERKIDYTDVVDVLVVENPVHAADYAGVATFASIAEGFDRAVCQGERMVRYDEIHVNANGAAKTTTGVTGSHGAVKREKVGHGYAVCKVATGARQTVAEGVMPLRCPPDIQTSAAEAKSQLKGVQDPLFV